jgi:hypothetical protein
LIYSKAEAGFPGFAAEMIKSGSSNAITTDASADDDRIRDAVLAAIEQAAWRPTRLEVTARDGVVSLRGIVKTDSARRAAIVAAENVPGVTAVLDNLAIYPPPEEDLGGGDFVSLQQEPSTADDEPL